MTTYTREIFEDSTFPIHIEKKTIKDDLELHDHDYYQFCIVCNGFATHIKNGKKSLLTAGSITVMNPTDSHSFINAEDFNIINLYIAPDIIFSDYKYFLDNNPRLMYYIDDERHAWETFLEERELDLIVSRIKEIELELSDKKESYKFEIVTILSRLATTLYRGFDIVREQDEIVDFIQLNYNKTISIDDIVEKFNLSKGAIFRKFKNDLGCSPIQYQTKLRIKRAKYLLKFTSKSISEIANEVGFPDSNYFSRQFKIVTSYTARNYRNTNKR